jgi:CheY-like chemotaxis protein
MISDTRDLRVFIAEDNQADVYLVQMALQEHGLRFQMTEAHDGEDAIRRMLLFQEKDCPDIALLDQNLPRLDGEKVMEAIRTHKHCKDIPIIMMTSSENRHDLDVAKQYNAVFFRKATDLTHFMELGALVKTLCESGKRT